MIYPFPLKNRLSPDIFYEKYKCEFWPPGCPQCTATLHKWEEERKIFNGFNWTRSIFNWGDWLVPNYWWNKKVKQINWPIGHHNEAANANGWGEFVLLNSNCLPNMRTSPSSWESGNCMQFSIEGGCPQVSLDNKPNRDTTRSADIHNLLVPPSKLELVNTETSVTLKAGSERSLSCRTRNARPQAKIVWYMGEHKILDQGNILSILIIHILYVIYYI